ncbi:hypothetical protein HYH03_000182 [Edaphochlamys debaryana]|uniref:DUF7906 domain-containing protein n=1 Tax=Edaphochlamys debaryana TaxID=47281 RepID=A0A835YNF9_9CHLO|nr:hypothetical protein HYH03_000182 [Edaphochlamys debaryana]|eukprot:KAG2501680.1 hypothetical protein HYH03_000182 [Edaphochlamys debaryana]
MPSYVHLNFTCNVVLIKRRNVMDAFERAIAAFSRPVDPALATGMQQVDAHKMELFIDHFIQALGLDQGYSLIVLNPTWHVDEPVYGYRMGMSSDELTLIKSQEARLRTVMSSLREAEPALPPQHPEFKGKHWQYGSFVAPKFTHRDATFDSEKWVEVVSAYLGQEEQFRRAVLQAAGKERGAAAMAQAARLLARPGFFLGSVLRKDLLESWETAADAVHTTFHALHPGEDCLVNTWVGTRGRWVMLDLTAGGKDWGPALGGDGTVHHQTLPHVHELFGGVRRLKENARHDETNRNGSTEQGVTEALAQARAARLPSVANRHHHAYLLKKQAMRRAAAAPGAPPMDPADKTKEEEEERAWRMQHQIVLLQAELDLLEEWAMRYCQGQERAPLSCGSWKDEAIALRAGLSKLHSATGVEAVYDLYRHHKWEIFGQEQDIGEINPELYDEEVISHDMLLSELSAVLSRAIRHVIAPPTATWTGRRVLAAAPEHAKEQPQGAPPTPRHSTAPPFAYQVNFHIFLVSDRTRQLSTQHSKSYSAANFDVEGYKAAVDTLKMYNQQFRFHVSRISLSDEPALAAGVAAATHTGFQEIPTSEDFFDEMERVYVDSRELAATLRRHFPPTKKQQQLEEAAQRSGRISLTAPVRDVPVYVLQMERDAPILLDEHYNARALEDMILVVANSARRDEHPTGMMCGGALVARPVSPLKEALAATLLHLGGVLPPHLGYNPRSHTVTHDWLWSVGAHPLSFTSTGMEFTTIQRDALGRAYLLDALDTSVEAVNAAIAQLLKAKPSAALFQHVKDHQAGVRDLLKKFADVVGVWRSSASMAYSLDFTTALEYLKQLEGDVNSLSIHAIAVSSLAEPTRCGASVVDRVGLLVPFAYLGSAAVVLASLLYAVLPMLFRRKAKAY